MAERGNFGSRLAIVLATAGSAVGLGNVWRFPFMAGQNGGAAFILIYFACVLLLGIPGMVSEFVVGRYSQANAARAYGSIGNRGWRWVGYLGILTSTIILGFYAVVAGWCLQYLFASLGRQLNGDASYVIEYFNVFSSDPVKPCLWAVGFVLITHAVVSQGVEKGIERASKLLMPLLLLLHQLSYIYLFIYIYYFYYFIREITATSATNPKKAFIYRVFRVVACVLPLVFFRQHGNKNQLNGS